MRCKRCGIQLTANNLDNCPNCGTPEDRGLSESTHGIFRSLLNVWSLASFGFLILVVLSILVYVLTKSVLFAVCIFVAALVVGTQFIFMFSGGVEP